MCCTCHLLCTGRKQKEGKTREYVEGHCKKGLEGVIDAR